MEVRRLSRKIPSIRQFVGPTEIIPLVVYVPRLPALHGDNRVELPTLEELALGFLFWKRIGDGKSEAVADVLVSAGVVLQRMRAVLWEKRNPVGGHIVQRVRISVAHNEV